MFGILVSFWDGLFSGAVLVSGSVVCFVRRVLFVNFLFTSFSPVWPTFARSATPPQPNLPRHGIDTKSIRA